MPYHASFETLPSVITFTEVFPTLPRLPHLHDKLKNVLGYPAEFRSLITQRSWVLYDLP